MNANTGPWSKCVSGQVAPGCGECVGCRRATLPVSREWAAAMGVQVMRKGSFLTTAGAIQRAVDAASRARLMLSIEAVTPKAELVSVLRFAETLSDDQLAAYLRELALNGTSPK